MIEELLRYIRQKGYQASIVETSRFSAYIALRLCKETDGWPVCTFWYISQAELDQVYLPLLLSEAERQMEAIEAVSASEGETT